MNKLQRVLIVTYYWPPSAGSGVQRWLKFAKYLPEYGWEPVIFTPENPDFDLQDQSLLQEIPTSLEVLKFPIWEPYQLMRMLKKEPLRNPSVILEKKKKTLLDKVAIWLRANLLVPDPRIFWVRPSIDFLVQIAGHNDFKAIITTGPPHSMHLIGRGLSRKLGIPWLADFRDPWSQWEFLDTLPITNLIRNRHRKLEESVFAGATRITTISPTFQKEMEKLAGRRVHLLTNGYDSSDIPADLLSSIPDQSCFQIVYTGIIDAIRNPIPFLQAFKSAFEKDAYLVNMTFVGKVSEQSMDFVYQDEWLNKHVSFTGYVTHKEVFEYYRKAHLLLLILTDTKNASGNIPGKLFEYMATQRRVIALGDPDGDAASILGGAGVGTVIRHTDVAEISSFLKEAFNRRNEERPKADISKYDRKTIAGELAALLDEMQVT